MLIDPASVLGPAACSHSTSNTSSCEFWDPTPLFDAQTQRLFLLTALTTSQTNRLTGVMTLWQLSSDDFGETWSSPKNITDMVWTQDYHQPTPANGHGIQLDDGTLLMPAYVVSGGRRIASSVYGDDNANDERRQRRQQHHPSDRANRESAAKKLPEHGHDGEKIGEAEARTNVFDAVMCSYDHGETWQFFPSSISTLSGSSEGELVALQHSPMLLFSHRVLPQPGGCGDNVTSCRWHSLSGDGGVSWGKPFPVPDLPDPDCKGGIAAWPSKRALLFVNNDSETQRVNVTLRVSYDDGMTCECI